MSRTAVTATITTTDAVNITTTDGQRFVAAPVLEFRSAGIRIGVRAGFGPTDAFVAYSLIATITAL